jgi:AcrR family transcriptional regulator
MARQYDSSRRRKAAEQTRNDILQAALKLHWEGITGFEPLAREAGCSVATLRKHFPSKETLFQHCTRAFAKTLTMPDLTALGEISETAQRVEQSVSELCRMHEAMFGYAWLALTALGEISETAQRVEQSVSELCRMHEAMFGYAWLAAQQREISPTLQAEMNAYEGLADAIAVIIELLATLHPLTVAGTD